eukprot:UC4_evm1s371
MNVWIKNISKRQYMLDKCFEKVSSTFGQEQLSISLKKVRQFKYDEIVMVMEQALDRGLNGVVQIMYKRAASLVHIEPDLKNSSKHIITRVCAISKKNINEYKGADLFIRQLGVISKLLRKYSSLYNSPNSDVQLLTGDLLFNAYLGIEGIKAYANKNVGSALNALDCNLAKRS